MMPPSGTVSVWRTLISSSYLHPGLLFHQDLSLIPELFLEMGLKLEGQDCSIRISMDESNPFGVPTAPIIRPFIPNEERFQVLFGEIEDCEVDPTQNCVIVRKYSLGKHIKRAVRDLVKFIRKFSKSIYLPDYGFLYDFFVRCGVTLEQLSEFVKTATIAATKRHEVKKLNKAAGLYKICHNKRLHKHRHRGSSSLNTSSSTEISLSPSPSRISNGLENGESVEKVSVLASQNGRDIKNRQSNPENGQFPLAKKRKTEGDVEAESKVDPNTNIRPINGLVTKKVKGESGEERIHFQCPSCPLFFTRRGGVYQHFRNKHTGESFPSLIISESSAPTNNVWCQFCDNCFITKGGLRQHLKKKHPVEAANILESWFLTPVPVPGATLKVIPSRPAAVPTVAPKVIPASRPAAVPTVAPKVIPASRPAAVPTVAPKVIPASTPKVIPASKPAPVPLSGTEPQPASIPILNLVQSTSSSPSGTTNTDEPRKLFKCSICGHTIKSKSGLKYHWKHTHPTETRNLATSALQNKNQAFKRIKCPFCDWRFMTRSGLRYHLKSKHTENELAKKALTATVDTALVDIIGSNSSDVQTSQSSQESDYTSSNTLSSTSGSSVATPTATPTASPIVVSRKERRPIEVKSISCPISNCSVLFTRRSALFWHFRKKHPNENLPEGVNYQGRLTNLKSGEGKVPRTQVLNHVLPYTHTNDNNINIPAQETLLDSNFNNINLTEIDNVLVTTEMDTLTATTSPLSEPEMSFPPDVFSTLEEIMGGGKAEVPFIVPALEGFSEDPAEEFERLLNSLESEEVSEFDV